MINTLDTQAINSSQSDNLCIQDDGRSCETSFSTFIAARIYLKQFGILKWRGGFNDDVRNYNDCPAFVKANIAASRCGCSQHNFC